ncbi:ABC transporter ATP-binding protein [Phenylobacterium terrae]|uniref:ABC transporter ATP-binding protein n=1 Tax=Phenylobacterium terrae TaxID=2665495 RepID=A0ABW4N3Q3_9CAUL
MLTLQTSAAPEPADLLPPPFASGVAEDPPSVEAARQGRSGDSSAWLRAVADAAKRLGAKGVSSTSALTGAPDVLGGGKGQLAGGRLRLSAERGARAYWALPAPAGEGGALVVAGVLRTSSVEDEKLQVRLAHKAGFEEEVLRISRSWVGVARRARLSLTAPLASMAFAMVIEGRRLAVWLDGRLVYRGPRSREDVPTAVVVDLLPVAANAADVLVDGLFVARKPADGVLSLWPEDDKLLIDIARQAVASGEVEPFTTAMSQIDPFPAIEDPELAQSLARLLVQAGVDEISFDKYMALCSKAVQARVQTLRANRRGVALVKFDDVTVSLPKNPSAAYTLSGLFSAEGRERFNALEHVSFQLNAGDILGVVGRNGSGKTTLLRTIMGLFPISAGAVNVNGKPLLLRPGAGMREDLSGRDNIVMAALFMGQSLRKARSIVDEVVDFAELEEAIDRPYRYYSDGMRARLIFSVATAITTEVLLLDELLSAGDIAFQAKAQTRLKEFISRAQAVIVVEHGLAFVQASATKVLLLHKGWPVYYGPRDRALDRYVLDVMSELEQVAPGRTR